MAHLGVCDSFVHVLDGFMAWRKCFSTETVENPLPCLVLVSPCLFRSFWTSKREPVQQLTSSSFLPNPSISSDMHAEVSGR